MAQTTRKTVASRVPDDRQVGEWFVTRNPRRLALIEKKHAIGLDAEETAELAVLKDELDAVSQHLDPRPNAMFEGLLAKIEAAHTRLNERRRTPE